MIRAYAIKANIRQYPRRNSTQFSHNFVALYKMKCGNKIHPANSQNLASRFHLEPSFLDFSSRFSLILYPLSMTCSGLESLLVPLFSEYSTLKSNYKYLVRIFCEYTCYWKWFGHWNRMIDFESPPSGFLVFILRPLGYEPLKISVWTCELISVGEIAQWFLLFVGHSTSTQGDNFSWK